MKTLKKMKNRTIQIGILIFLKILPVVLLIGLGSFTINPKKFILTDATTRLVYDIEPAALKLEASDKSSTETKHTPRAYPDGVKEDYKMWLRPTTFVPDRERIGNV